MTNEDMMLKTVYQLYLATALKDAEYFQSETTVENLPQDLKDYFYLEYVHATKMRDKLTSLIMDLNSKEK